MSAKTKLDRRFLLISSRLGLVVALLALASAIIAHPGIAQTPAPQESRGLGLKIRKQEKKDPASEMIDPANRPELVLQTGHAQSVEALAFSSDERFLASGGVEGLVKLWDVGLGRELRMLAGHPSGVTTLVFAPDYSWLATGGRDGRIILWDVATGNETRNINGHKGQVSALAVSRDRHFLASGGEDKSVQVWEVSTNRPSRTLPGHNGRITALAFSPNGRLLASGSADQTIRLWDLEKGGDPRQLGDHSSGIQALAFSPDGETLASAGLDQTVRLWKVSRPRSSRLLIDHAQILALSYPQVAPGASTTLLAGIIDREVRRYTGESPRDGTTLLKPGGPNLLQALAFSPRGRWAAASIGDGRVELRALDGSGIVRRLETISNAIYATAISPNGRWFASAHDDNTVKLWDLNAGREVKTLRGIDGSVNAISFSPDSERLVAGHLSGAIRMWEINGGRQLFRTDGHTRSVNSLVFSAGGKQFISGSSDGTIAIWDAATGAPVRRLTGHTKDVMTLAISGDGKFLVSVGVDQTAIVWRTGDWGEAYRLKNHHSPVFSSAFSPDGKLLATGTEDGTTHLWDAANGNELRKLRSHAGLINAAVFSPDGSALITGSAQGEVKIWDPATGVERIKDLGKHAGAVRSIAISPDGLWFVSASDDGATRLWEAATGKQLATLVSFVSSDEWLVVTPSGLFDGSSAAAWGQIIWRFGGDTFKTAPVESFFNEFFYPEVLADLLNGKNPRPPQDISIIDRRQPEVELAVETKAGEGRATIQLKVTAAQPDAVHSSASGARDLRLFRNGTLVKVWRDDLLDGQTSKTLQIEAPLVAGENRFTAYAFNSDNVKSRDAERVITGPTDLRREGKLYLLAIGINDYTNPNFKLQTAVTDAAQMGAAMAREQTQIGRFAQVEVVTISDGEATRATILAALGRLKRGGAESPAQTPLARLRPAEPQDAIIIYFAGHGVAIDDHFYLLPYDLGYDGPRTDIDERGAEQLALHGISDAELERELEDVDAGYLTLIIDACQSGQALESTERRRGPMNSKGLAQLAYEKGMNILTAAQSYQLAFESKKMGASYLVHALLEDGLRLRAADYRPRDQIVQLREWFDYATERVPQILEEKDRSRGLRIKVNQDYQRPRVFYRREAESDPLVIALIK